MIRQLSLLACAMGASLAVAASASASLIVEVLDFSGTPSDGTLANPGFSQTVNISAPSNVTVLSFQWVLVFEAFSPSWGSEARIDITAPDMTTFTFSGAAAGWDTASGLYFDEDNTAAFDGVQLAGDWTFTFYESFNDPITPDGLYHAGLFVITAIPAPGAIALLGLAALASPGRRRRG